MTEPRRLRQGGGPTQRLLDSASLDVPSLASRRRAALLASTAGAFASTARAAQRPPPTSTLRTLVTWGCIGAAASIGLASAGSKWFDAPHGHAGETTAPMAELPSTRNARPTDIAPEVVPLGVEPWVASPSSGSGAPEEIRQIDAARAAIRRGDPAAALTILGVYEESPGATLRAEATVLRVQALLQAGRETEARTLARECAARFPHDAATQRIPSALR